MNIEEYRILVDKQSKELEGYVNLVVDSMTLGEVREHLKRMDFLENALTKNIITLAELEDLKNNNKNLEDFREDKE